MARCAPSCPTFRAGSPARDELRLALRLLNSNASAAPLSRESQPGGRRVSVKLPRHRSHGESPVLVVVRGAFQFSRPDKLTYMLEKEVEIQTRLPRQSRNVAWNLKDTSKIAAAGEKTLFTRAQLKMTDPRILLKIRGIIVKLGNENRLLR